MDGRGRGVGRERRTDPTSPGRRQGRLPGLPEEPGRWPGSSDQTVPPARPMRDRGPPLLQSNTSSSTRLGRGGPDEQEERSACRPRTRGRVGCGRPRVAARQLTPQHAVDRDRSRPRHYPERGRWRGRDSRPPGPHPRLRYRGSRARSLPAAGSAVGISATIVGLGWYGPGSFSIDVPIPTDETRSGRATVPCVP
jgi:hypothetical protein